jgi:hypothetical protein
MNQTNEERGHVGRAWDGEDHSPCGFNFHQVYIPLNQLVAAILDCGIKAGSIIKRKFAIEPMIFTFLGRAYGPQGGCPTATKYSDQS